MQPALATPDERQRLAALSETGLLDTLPEQVYDDITALAACICEAPIALVSRALTLGVTRHLTKARATEDEFVNAVRVLLNGLFPTARSTKL
jgi:hypothetical protein